MAILVLIHPDLRTIDDHWVARLSTFFNGEDIVLVANRSEFLKLPDRYTLHVVGNIFSVSEITNIEFTEVVLFGFDSDKLLTSLQYQYFVSQNVKNIHLFDGHVLSRYRPFKDKRSRILLVFPGPIIPLNMGSHQRVFNLIVGLAYAGYYVDVLITGGDIHRASRLLEGVCPKVYNYKNRKRKMPRLLSLRRGIERRCRQLFGMSEKVPELFIDRLSNKSTFSLKKTLKNILVQENEYENVIVSYAWMAKCSDLLDEDQRKKYKWICDTHDVQYVRNGSSNNLERRFLYSSWWDRKIEVDTLAQFDAVLAISESDCAELGKSIKSKIIRVGSSFGYMLEPICGRNEIKPLAFGFIGGGMDANVRALIHILQEWWPSIRRYSPASKLFVAGTVVNDSRIVDLISFDESIVKLGFVKNLNEFYSKIDVSLNPVLIQGGLNFKSVEAVFAGKILMTNSLGTKCLGEAKIADVVANSTDIENILSKYEVNSELMMNTLKERQQIAIEYFGDEGAYAGLKEYLDDK